MENFAGLNASINKFGLIVEETTLHVIVVVEDYNVLVGNMVEDIMPIS
jgi:hypothetical protein